MDNKKYFSYLDIISQLDISKNDIILVSSDILKLLIVSRENYEIFDSNKFIDTIINKIGDGGTLLFPAYNWDFCNGKTFDYYNTPSNSGALSKIALNKKGFGSRCTWRPLHSLDIFKNCPSDNMENSINFYNKSANLPSSPILNIKKFK